MRRILALAIVALGSLLPAQAESGQSAFDAYLRSQNIPIHGISGSGADCRIDFKPEATKQQKEAAENARASFDWSDRQDPKQKLKKFKNACLADSDISTKEIGWLILLTDDSLTNAQRKALWTKAKNAIGANEPSIGKIESHAQEEGLTIK